MIWPLTIFRTGPLRWREIPWKLFTAASFGAIATGFVRLATAPIFGEGVGWRDLAVLMAIGAEMALAFYITCGIPPLWLFPRLGAFSHRTALLIRFMTPMAGGVAGFLLAALLVNWTTGIQLFGLQRMGAMLTVEAFIALGISLVITAIKEYELRARKLSETAARAQAAALQAQINPHFFFNTLNTVSALISVNPTAAQRIIGRMADMFRYTLEASQAESVTLEQELEFVRNYLAVEAARFGDRLTIDISPSNGASGVRLPGLTLQPLAENAVRHGVARRIEGGRLKVAVSHTEVECRITVQNEYDDEPDLRPSVVFREGHALANVRDRLQLFRGPAATIEVTRDGQWVTSTVVIPKESR